MEQSPQQVRKFYNNYIPRQSKVGLNLRHYFIYNKLIGLGLKKEHNILEVGCGIGTLTLLFSKYLKSGCVHGTDISDQSIELANKKFDKQANISFEVSDMTTSLKTNLKFDYVVFADVLEHIPLENWVRVFERIIENTHGQTKFFANIPHPELNRFYFNNDKSKLQIIDHELTIKDFKSLSDNYDLRLVKWEEHSLFNAEPDYIWMLWGTSSFRKTYSPKNKIQISSRKQYLRLKTFISRF